MINECCLCEHWHKILNDKGQCRRYAPKPTLLPIRAQDAALDNVGNIPNWVITRSSQWCGDFKLDSEKLLKDIEANG